jgi:DNA-binding MarR family transcriptional regulator
MLGHELSTSLRAAFFAMHSRMETALRPFGVSAEHYLILATLNQSKSLTQRELASKISCDPNTLRAMLLQLEKKDLLLRKSHPHDARARLIEMTGIGEMLFQKLWEADREVRQEMVEILSEKETIQITKLLRQLTFVLKSKTDDEDE